MRVLSQLSVLGWKGGLAKGVRLRLELRLCQPLPFWKLAIHDLQPACLPCLLQPDLMALSDLPGVLMGLGEEHGVVNGVPAIHTAPPTAEELDQLQLLVALPGRRGSTLVTYRWAMAGYTCTMATCIFDVFL